MALRAKTPSECACVTHVSEALLCPEGTHDMATDLNLAIIAFMYFTYLRLRRTTIAANLSTCSDFRARSTSIGLPRLPTYIPRGLRLDVARSQHRGCSQVPSV